MMATPLAQPLLTRRRVRPGRLPGPAAAEYQLRATLRGIAEKGAAALGMLTGLWVAISPLFIMRHGDTNANVADLIAGQAPIREPRAACGPARRG
jgi:hypothetical protein